MKLSFFILFLFLSIGTLTAQKPRLIVTTDIGQDPDDEQSLVRLLHYSNEFDLEGLIANADANYDKEAAILKAEIIHKMIDSYAAIEKNLLLHATEYPKSTYLHTIVKEGTFGNGHHVPMEDFIGKNHDTEGSDWIIKMVDKKDPRPVNVAIWGGACDLAQALWKIQHSRNKNEVEQFVEKLRVFFIGKQDSSNQWIIDTFPNIWLILALDRNGNKWESGYRGMFWGGDMRNTSKEWLHENIISQNALASHYPDHAYTGGEGKNPHMAMKEGDSPSFLYFLENGLNQPDHPEWGNWGGRYLAERDQFYRDANDDYFDEQTGKIINSPRATVFRWRIDFQNDFAARVQWGTKKYSEANHHPVIIVNGENGKSPLRIKVESGDRILLDASKSSDFDKDNLGFEWLVYKEAGTYMGTMKIKKPDKPKLSFKSPKDAKGTNIHLICRVTDNGIPALTSYKRVIIQIE
ncbi:DUF1593 domain-containing protein [Fulvivirgaceae bacterium BMA12]|uniref:DUF1593 domain-containing protein n=1 Tax=Agaribacillus aureus TaxID=3051825 RepID=A0ABT8LJX7_9BACT|nr:DUF1593 domain-containing protein [Fulvivirgaceae bacterium BMA12]